MGSSYSHLSLEDRRKIERWRQAKVSPTRMAEALGRHRSTIFRELKRNHFKDDQWHDICGYCAVAAHHDCARRRSRKRKLDLKHVSEADLKEITDRLNSTPRKCLGWKTPAEVFREKMLAT